ncbi:MAG: 4-alpha-glucanotransferase [Anaeromyxobacteraceae bacterium]|nr:4-alpha-glucanotransferase [Anaeromyxobacteraceae bacterium]
MNHAPASPPRPDGDRRSGLLLHPSSLPGPFGIGDLGPRARDFADLLAGAGQRLWQVLPLGPTGFGDSPYQALGAFAGNPMLISPELLHEEGLLTAAELDDARVGGEGPIDHGTLIPRREALLRHVADRLLARSGGELRRDLERFREERAAWLPDLALFLAVKAAHGGAPWTAWDPELAVREAGALARARGLLRADVESRVVGQFLFDRQWRSLRAHCHERGVALMGDLPIYVAHDSAEVWARRELFHLDGRGNPTVVAGVPPDYFSATGQLWGNPIYRWEERLDACTEFLVERARSALAWLDEVRLDHFRGFEAYWAIPAGAATSVQGAWRPGPGRVLFERLRRELGGLPFVAENLGVITPPVEALRREFGLPGMAILQFAFGTDPQGPSFRPHRYAPDLVAYTGTHDNDTVAGWWASDGSDSTRKPEDVVREKALARRYLDTDGSGIHWVLLRAIHASVARTVVAPVQDVLGLGSEARMNRPGTAAGNWRWRLRAGQLAPAQAARLAELTALYDRA